MEGGAAGEGGEAAGTGGGTSGEGGDTSAEAGEAGTAGDSAGGGTAGSGGTTGKGGAAGTGAGGAGGASGLSLIGPFTPETQDATMAVDGVGRIHVIARDFNGGAFVYATCASNCALAANWQSSAFTPTVAAVNDDAFVLRATSDGKLRLMVQQAGKLTRYSCAGSCLMASNWKAINVAASADLQYTDHSYYAIGSGGQEAAIYSPRFLSDTFTLASCSANCDQGANWQETTLPWNGRSWTNINVDVTASGAIGVAARDFLSPTVSIAYGQCLSNCTSAASWSPLLLLEGSSGDYAHALAVSPEGLPRIALVSDGSDARVANKIRLLSCESGCGAAENWRVLVLGSQTGGVGSKRLWLDYAGSGPLLAYRELSAVGIGRCSANCEHSSSGWSIGLVGDSTNIPAVIPTSCTSSLNLFDDGSLMAARVGAGYALMAGIKGEGFGGSCGTASPFDFSTVVAISAN
jgi:hypothetical protein